MLEVANAQTSRYTLTNVRKNERNKIMRSTSDGPSI